MAPCLARHFPWVKRMRSVFTWNAVKSPEAQFLNNALAGFYTMDIFFQDPNEVRLPPEEVRLSEMHVTPLADGNRVKVYLELTPFIKRPNIEVIITSVSGKEAATTG